MRTILIVGGDRGRFPASDCLLVKGARSAVLVDAGCGPENVSRARDKVDLVVYTHIHPDHIAQHNLLAGKPARVPAADHPYKALEELALRYAPEIAHHWVAYARTVFGLKAPPRGEPYEPWEEIRAGDVSLVMIPARGHTAGHHYVLAGTHLHLSDVDLTGFGPWYGHPESSITGYIADMRAALQIEAKTYSTSHREKMFTREELPGEMERYLGALCRQVESVLRVLDREHPHTPRSLAGRGLIYRRYIPGMETVMRYFETQIIAKILELLEAFGDAEETRDGYVRRAIAPRTCENLQIIG